MNEIEETYIIQVDNFKINDFMFYWIYYRQPCMLQMVKPNTEGFTAVRVVVQNAEAGNFVLKVEEKAGCILHKVEKQTS